MTPNREELIERLKEISEDKTEYELSMGAMCYSMSFPEEENFLCDSCGKNIKYSFFMSSYQKVYSLVNEIKQLGYDVKVEDLCINCLKNKVEGGKYIYSDKVIDSIGELSDSLFIVFFFRTNENEKYHLTVSNNSYDYIALINFLKGENQYYGSFGRTHLLSLIRDMTGLSIN